MSLHNFLWLHLRSYFQNSSSCFIVVTKHLATIKALGLRRRAFICFSVFGYPDETLTLVLEIVRNRLKRTSVLVINLAVADLLVRFTEPVVLGTLDIPHQLEFPSINSNRVNNLTVFQKTFSFVSVFF